MPVCVADMRAKDSSLEEATDASEEALEETRTSPWTAQGRVALQELQQVIPHCSGLVELFEIFAKGVGYVFFQSQLCLLASRRAQRSDSGQINCELFEPASWA